MAGNHNRSAVARQAIAHGTSCTGASGGRRNLTVRCATAERDATTAVDHAALEICNLAQIDFDVAKVVVIARRVCLQPRDERLLPIAHPHVAWLEGKRGERRSGCLLSE